MTKLSPTMAALAIQPSDEEIDRAAYRVLPGKSAENRAQRLGNRRRQDEPLDPIPGVSRLEIRAAKAEARRLDREQRLEQLRKIRQSGATVVDLQTGAVSTVKAAGHTDAQPVA